MQNHAINPRRIPVREGAIFTNEAGEHNRLNCNPPAEREKLRKPCPKKKRPPEGGRRSFRVAKS